MKKNPLTVKDAKLMRVLNLSDDEVKKLNQLRIGKDINGIKNFFINEEKYNLHSAEFNVIDYEKNILIFSCHAFLDKNVIVIVHNNIVYEYIPKLGKRFFLGGLTNTIYSVGITEKPKPVIISFSS